MCISVDTIPNVCFHQAEAERAVLFLNGARPQTTLVFYDVCTRQVELYVRGVVTYYKIKALTTLEVDHLQISLNFVFFVEWMLKHFMLLHLYWGFRHS